MTLWQRFSHRVTHDTTAGVLLIVAALLALIWANSPWRGAYETLSHTHIGPSALGLNLSIHAWAADGILVIFFFVVGLELKTEFVTGALRDIRQAALPMLAACFGVLGPALVFLVIQAVTGSPHMGGWAIPTATDIAFAVALLGVFGRGLPPAARTFLLTLAVVDDLLVIIIIASVFTSSISFIHLGVAVLAVALFGVLTARRITAWWLLVPLALVAWWATHASGIHATIAGVALGLVVPAKVRKRSEDQLTHRFAHAWQPISSGFAVPIFAFFAAGVNVVDGGGLGQALASPVSLGVMIGLPLGKLLGIWGSVSILTRWTGLRLGNGLNRPDIFAVALLAGVGFTVALLVAQLAFPTDPSLADDARLAVLCGSFIAAILGAVALRLRVRVHRRGGRDAS